MTHATADDAAGVTPETARVMQDLEDVRSHVVTFALPKHVAAIDSAIDRLIVLDPGEPRVPSGQDGIPGVISVDLIPAAGIAGDDDNAVIIPRNNDHQSYGA